MSQLKVATWNVNSLKARMDRVRAFLERHEPDVLALQELKGTEDIFPFESFRLMGYHAAVFGQKTYNGVAILSRSPLKQINRSFHDDKEDPSARFVSAVCDGLHLQSAYIPNGQEVGSEKYFYKLEWLSRLRAYLDKHHEPNDPLLLMGDFNVAPEDRDVHDPQAWQGKLLCSAPERKGLQRVLDFGLSDTFRLHHEAGGLYSWWDYRQLGFPKNRGLRIDFIFASQGLAKACRKAYIDRDERKGEKPSDHAPVLAEFEI